LAAFVDPNKPLQVQAKDIASGFVLRGGDAEGDKLTGIFHNLRGSLKY